MFDKVFKLLEVIAFFFVVELSRDHADNLVRWGGLEHLGAHFEGAKSLVADKG